MDCSAFCSATSFQMKLLFEMLQTRYRATLYRDVIHIEVPGDPLADVFYFSYGAVICWNLTKEQGRQFVSIAQPFERQPMDELEIDEFTFIYGESAKILDDEIILPNFEILTKLAISFGLAQSIKLGAFETMIQKTFNNMQHIPEALAKHGKISLSRREIRRKMGELFIDRNSINLHVNVLDAPEFFWEYPEFDPLYKMAAIYLDLENREQVLSQRLRVLHELFEMLGTELNNQHSSRLEWIIIMLIVIEVAVSLLTEVFHIL